jgi:hypothetical protein
MSRVSQKTPLTEMLTHRLKKTRAKKHHHLKKTGLVCLTHYLDDGQRVAPIFIRDGDQVLTISVLRAWRKNASSLSPFKLARGNSTLLIGKVKRVLHLRLNLREHGIAMVYIRSKQRTTPATLGPHRSRALSSRILGTLL